MRVSAFVLGASVLLVASRAFAQDPAPPPADTPPAPAQAPAPAPAPASAPGAETPASSPASTALPERELARTAPESGEPITAGPRAEGMRLGLDLSFARSGSDEQSRVNAGSPSLLPLGADVSWRTSAKVLLGFHGHLALASRDDCLGETSCTGRGYALGAHIEAAFSSTGTFIPYFRYGMGWEMVHQMGAFRNEDAYRYRHAFDILDVRFGGDFVLSRREGGRTTRLGPFVGMIAGISVDEVSNGRGARPDDFGAGHLWFAIGARATMDP